MTNSKMTEREIYNSMIDGTIDRDVLVEFAEKKLAQLDKRNASAAKRAAAKRAEGDELTEAVFGFVSDEPQTREDITSAMVEAGHEVTVGKVQARLTRLFNDGRIAKAKAKVAGEDGKSKQVTVWAFEFAE